MKGFQGAGFLNICDSIDGVPLAFISVVRKNGYRKLDSQLSEVQYANLSFKMGVKQSLHHLFFWETHWTRKPVDVWWRTGNRDWNLSEKMMLNIEGTVHQELWIGNQASPYFLHIDRLNLYNSIKVPLWMEPG